MFKKINFIIAISFLIISNYAYADQLEVLTKDQATKAYSYLKDQQFIMMYCGCCDNEPVKLLNLQKVEVVPFGSMFSIKLTGIIFATINYDKETLSYADNFDNKETLFSSNVDLAYIHDISDFYVQTVGAKLGFEHNPCYASPYFPLFQTTKTSGTLYNYIVSITEYYTALSSYNYESLQSSPENLVNGLFHFAKIGNFENLKNVCDASGDGDAKTICNLSSLSSSQQLTFINYFKYGYVEGKTVFSNSNEAEVPIRAGENLKDDKIKCRKINGKWYLYSL